MPPIDEQPRRILPLSPDAIAQIHSSKHITSLNGVVLSLFENSLDADSTKVDITVDWKRGNCEVEDDGTGIAAEEFAEEGGLGKMYCTSRRSPGSVNVHGSRGTFLAELSSMSLLTISSTHSSSTRSASLSLHQGKVIARRLAPRDALSMLSSRQGTHVAVHDLFGNMPVRVKQRALSSSDETSWQDLKRGVVALLLAWPKPCSVRLRNANSSTHLINISGLHTNLAPELTSKSLRRLAGQRSSVVSYDPMDVLPILFQSGFASPESRSSWVPLSASTSAISLKGLICKDPTATKQCQFISLGVTPCGAADGDGEWYECVNRVFANSGFGIVEDDTFHVQQKQNEGKESISRKSAMGKPSKGIDRHPMFYLQLNFKDDLERTWDPTRLSGASLKVVEDVLEAAVTAWLEAHLFRPRKPKSRRRKNEDQEGPAQALSRGTPKSSRTESSLPGTPVGREAHRLLRAATNSDKRARVTDMFGRPITQNPNTTAGGGPDQLSSLSRMRSGRPRSGVQSSCQSSTILQHSESVRPFTADDSGNRQKQRRLAAPPIEVGQYSDLKSRQTPIRKSPERLEPRRQTESSLDRPSGAATTQKNNVPSSDDFGSINSAALLAVADRFEAPAEHEVDDIVTWTDPATKQVHRVNSRTGVVLTHSGDSRSISGPMRTSLSAFNTGSLSSAGRPLSLSRRSALAAGSLLKSTPNIGSYVATNSEPRADFAEDPTAINDVKSANEREKWLPGFLREWKNPVFALRKEPPIPVASYHGPGLLFSATEIDHHSCHSRANGAEFHSSDKGINLSKAALREARVISQVDQKFILAVLPPVGENVSSGTSPAPPTPTSRSKHADTLILIDQHAASERVMLEELLNDLCTPTTGGHPLDDADKEVLEILRPVTRVHSVPLQPVLEFDIPLSEQVVLEKYRAWFLKWGFIYQLSSLAAPKEPPISSHPFPALRSHVPVSGSPTLTRTKKKSNELRLKLTHLPPCIAARCQKEPKLAIDLIRGEAWRVAEEGVPKDVTIGKRARKIATDTASHTDHDHEESYDLATTAEDKDSRKATDTPVWLPVLPLIPPALLSLLHSRACRSAIMFNDVLNRPACEELVKKLSKCVFPFVCAHGRVGVVPVGVLDGETGEGSGLGSSIGLDLHLGDCGEQEATAHGEGARLGAWVRDQRATSDGNNG